MGYRHYGFWSCMDTLKEKNFLEELWVLWEGSLENMAVNMQRQSAAMEKTFADVV